MKPLFILPGPTQWASSRYRAIWVAEHIEGAATATPMQDFETDDYDAFICVKVADPKFAREMTAKGKPVYWDVCDPAWWWNPNECREITDAVTGVVASCQSLAEDFNAWYGKDKAVVIPDRMNLEHYAKQREHRPADPIRFIWYGATQNRLSVFGGLANLERLIANGIPCELTIMDDKPDDHWLVSDSVPFYYVKWDLGNENEIIAAHDIAFLPPYPGPWGKVKSNNKTLTAWACGVPVTDAQNYRMLKTLCDSWELRMDEGAWGRKQVEAHYNVAQSAEDWRRLLCAS